MTGRRRTFVPDRPPANEPVGNGIGALGEGWMLENEFTLAGRGYTGGRRDEGRRGRVDVRYALDIVLLITPLILPADQALTLSLLPQAYLDCSRRTV